MKKFQEACEELLSEGQDYVKELFDMFEKTAKNYEHIEDVFIMQRGLGSMHKMLRVEFKNGQVIDIVIRNKNDE